MKKILIGLAPICLCAATLACQKKEAQAPAQSPKKLTVVTTLFPVYDFARAVAGDKAEVTVLLPPGVETFGFYHCPHLSISSDSS